MSRISDKREKIEKGETVVIDGNGRWRGIREAIKGGKTL